MYHNQRFVRGFSFVEVSIALLILLILGALGINAFLNAKTTKNLEIISTGLVFTLNQARSDALAGKNSSAYGVHIASTSYSYFAGGTYNPSASDNRINNIPSGWRLSTSTSNGESQFVFRRLSGNSTASGTVSVIYLANPTKKIDIIVEQNGNISVVK